MAITKVNGTKGTKGTNGKTPTKGGNGGDAMFSQNGQIGLDSITVQVNGGDGGAGGNVTNGGTGAGAAGGDGGNATIAFNGNIFNAPATTNLTVSLTATGGNGGDAGTGPGVGTPSSKGGNASVTANGNILQPSKAMNTIEMDAIAVAGQPGAGGTLGKNGNATATLSGNIVQPTKASTVTLLAQAISPGNTIANIGSPAFGTQAATVTGNIVQGNINTVTLEADALYSNSTATLSGNIVQITGATNTGTVTFIASGQHIDFEQNKVTLGKQEFDLTINQFGPNYDTLIKGNEFTGTGTNTFVFTDNVLPGPLGTPDTIAIDLNAQTFMFDGKSNKLKGFANATVGGNNDATITGSTAANVLVGGGGNDLLTGGAGNDTIDGGAGAFDTAVYSGNFAQYTLSFNPLLPTLPGTVTDTVAGRDGTDTLQNVEFLKFADGLYDVANHHFIPNVAPANHAPAGTDKTITTLEDTAYTFTAADFGFTDPNDLPANNLLAVKISTLPTAAMGTLTDNGVAVTAGQSVSVADINGGKLIFTPFANANGNAEAAFTFQVQDDGGVAGGGIDLDQSPNTITFNVTPVNDAPAGTDKTITTFEDTAYTFGAADFGFTDAQDAAGSAGANSLLAVRITTLPLAGSLTDNGVAVNAGDSIAVADITSGKLQFTPAANANGAGYAGFTFQVQDNGGTANGGVDLDQTPNTITVNVTSVNDAPAGADNTVSAQLNTPYAFTLADFGFTDPNDSPANGFLAVRITTLPAHGTLVDNGVPVTAAGSFVSAADIAAGLLVFVPAQNASGTHYGDFTFQVQDNGGTTNGGVDLDQSPNAMTINVSNGQTFTGTPGADNLVGGAGNDTFIASTGNDTYNGMGGTDTLVFNSSTGPLAVDLGNTNPQAIGGGYGTDTILNIEKVDTSATSSNNTLTGSSANNVLTGGAGDDTLIATAGNDTLVGNGNTVVGDTADFRNFAGGVTIDLNNAGAQSLGGADTVTLSGIENLTGGAGNDVFIDQAGANNTYVGAGGIDTVKIATPLSATTIAWTGSHFTVSGANGTDTVDVEVLQGSTGPKTLLVGGPGGFSSINAAIAAASAGDTILIAPGTYNENVVVNKAGLTLQGAGPGVIIEGTFTEDNGNFAGPLSTWLQTAPGYSGASGTGINVSADNVTLKNLTVDDFLSAVGVAGAAVSGLTLDGVTTQHSVNGFTKPDATALNGLNITNSTFQDEYIGAGFYNDLSDGSAKDATNTTIQNSLFQNIDIKGVYMETAQGNTTLDNLTMTNVGQYGGVPSFGANGLNGNGIDLNLKYHTYTGTVDISGFNMTDVGGSGGQNGAIVVEGRDDAPSYSPIPANVSGLTVNIHDGSIDGTTTGVRAGENKPGGDTGPATTITNVGVTNATVADFDNHTSSLMTVTGTTGNDHLVAAQTSIGPITINGLDGDDILGGGLGNDTLLGGAGNDTLFASGGTDTLNGGANTDTADFSFIGQGVNISLGATGFQSLGSIGQVKLVAIENLNGTAFNDVLSGSTGNNVINGGAGDDTFLTSGGKDTFDGGTGNNTLDLSGLAAGVTINLASAGAQNVGGTDTVKLANIQNLTGTGFDDTLKGDANNNILIGGAGNDTITGGGGTLDIFFGGAGDDSLTGSAGTTTDVAYFQGLETGHTIGGTGTLGSNNAALNVTVTGAADGTDTMVRMDRIKFLSPSHVSDLDDNGFGDLVYQDGATGTIKFVAHPGTTAKTLATVPGASWGVVGTGQFTPDAAGVKARSAGLLLQDSGTGDMEVVTGININNGNSTSTLLSSPTGTFAGWKAISTGDFDGDASSDILLQKSTGEVEIAFLNGIKGEAVGTVDSIQSVTTPDASGNWKVTAVGDFDGDGHSDILFRNTTNNNLVIDTMRGSTIESSASFTPGANLTAVATGDFNGDGTSDILFQNSDGTAAIWTMNGTSQTGTISAIAAPGANFTLAGAEDINGDGVSDLIWHNALTGETQGTLMLAGGVVGATSQIGIAPANTLHLIASTGGG